MGTDRVPGVRGGSLALARTCSKTVKHRRPEVVEEEFGPREKVSESFRGSGDLPIRVPSRLRIHSASRVGHDSVGVIVIPSDPHTESMARLLARAFS